MPAAQALRELARGDASFLRAADLRPETLSQAFRLGPGAPYYLFFWLSDLGMREQALAMLRLAWERGRGRWKEEAALLLLEDLAGRGEWAEAERLGRQSLGSVRTRELRFRVERSIAEAVYWQRRDAELLKMLERLKTQDEELELFRAVSSCRTGIAGWEEQFRGLFFKRRASALHARAYSFLQIEDRLKSFPAWEAAFFEAKAALFESRTEQALSGLEAALPRIPAERLRGTPVLAESAGAFLQSGQFGRGSRLLASVAGSLPQTDPLRLEAEEWAGRLYRRAGEAGEAERLLREVMRSSSDPQQRDRASWFVLDLARERSRQAFIEELGSQSPSWSDPEYFADILDREAAGIIAQRQWKDLLELRRVLPEAGPRTIRARLALLSGRLEELGLVSIGIDPREAYAEAARMDPGGYYGWLASALIGAGEEPAYAVSPADELEEPEDPENPEEHGAAVNRVPEAFILGFFEFGLYRRGYERILADRAGLSARFLLRAAQELNGSGELLLSLRLMNLYLSARDQSAPPAPSEAKLRREELELFYPRGFLEHVEELSRQEDLPSSLFFALVREESHFDPRIVSSAGAVGLTQLLPETALDLAQRMRIPEPDLRDPRANLGLGARHLARHLALLKDVPKALIAYNAGLSRLRGWERSFNGLPTELLVEALPFPETRRYVRKILVSAVHYGYLYYGLSPRETVRLFFPQLFE